MVDDSLPPYQGRDDLDPRLIPLRRERWARELSELRLGYELVDAWHSGATVADISAAAGRPQQWVADEIDDLITDPTPRVEGRLGRRPLEVIYRYLVKEIDRAQLIEELATWPYEPYPEMGPFDEYEPEAPGSYQEVIYAESSRLLSADELADISQRLRDSR